MFGHLMANSTVLFYTDNEGVKDILNQQTSSNKIIMSMLRPLVLLLKKHNIRLTSKHIPGIDNILCDRISRFQVTPELLQQ